MELIEELDKLAEVATMELIEELDKLAADATREAMEFPADNEYLLQVMRRLANQASQITFEKMLNPAKAKG